MDEKLMTGILEDPDLVDPDNVTTKHSSFRWDEEFQRHIVSMIISDRQFMLQSIDLINAEYFSNKAHRKIAEISQKFFREYRVLAKKEFLSQEIKDQIKEPKNIPFYIGELNVIFDFFEPGLEARDYLMDKITYFAKMQSFRQAFTSGLKLLDENPESQETWEKIYNKIEKVITTTSNFDLGTNYFEEFKKRYETTEENNESQDKFLTGIDGVDENVNGGGYNRGEILSIVAGSGVGKSVMLACIAATNLLRGYKGLYITLELREEKVADRMDAILTGLPVQMLYNHKDEIFDKLTSLKGVDYDSETLVIKQFPAGTATVNKIRAYLSQLKFHGFEPDFLIVDYVGEMQDTPGMPTYESREKAVRDLRGLGTEENIFVATAMQPNRTSKEDRKNNNILLDDSNLADSFGQIRPLDGCLSLNQSDTEKELGIGRGYVIKQRDGKSRYQFYLKFDKESLRITEMSLETYKNIRNTHVEVASDEVLVDQVRPFKPS